MGINKKLAILRTRHRTTGGSYISDEACREMIITNSKRLAVLDYWADTTDGYLDFSGSYLFPWVDITLTSEHITQNPGNRNDFYIARTTLAQLAYEATANRPGYEHVTSYDGFIVLIIPGTPEILFNPFNRTLDPLGIRIDTDSAFAVPALQSKNVSVINVMNATHSRICHEVGHTLGFRDSCGFWPTGAEVYNDPYDIMSAERFGNNNPTFNNPNPVINWPTLGATRMGPAPVRAHIHLWNPEAIPDNKLVEIHLPLDHESQIRLYPAGGTAQSVELVVIHPTHPDPSRRGTCYLEFRDIGDIDGWHEKWDAGLHTIGPDLARRAVVAHVLKDGMGIGGMYCCYRGKILIPVEADTDLAIPGTGLIVRVIEANIMGDISQHYVDLIVSTVYRRGIDIDAVSHDWVVDDLSFPRRVTTPCGDPLIYSTRITRTTTRYQPLTYGYGGSGQPGTVPGRITWQVGGLDIPSERGNLNVPTSNGVFMVEYEIDPITFTLTLTSQQGDKYSVDVVAIVREPVPGGNWDTKSHSFDPQGSFTGFADEGQRLLNSCMERILIRVDLRPSDILLPYDPDPFGNNPNDRINEARLQQVIQQLRETHLQEAIELGNLTQLRYGRLSG